LQKYRVDWDDRIERARLEIQQEKNEKDNAEIEVLALEMKEKNERIDLIQRDRI